MGLRHRSKPHPAKDLTPGPPQNFVADAVSSTVFALSWQEDPNKTLPDDFDLDFSLASNSGPWTPIPINKVYAYNHTGQDITVRHWWRLVAKHAGFASASVVATDIAYRPVFIVAPPTSTIPAGGGSIQFTATDVDGGLLTYSLAFKYRSDIFINPNTGLVTVPATAAGTNGDIIVRCTDSIGLYAETTCSVAVLSASAVRFVIPATVAGATTLGATTWDVSIAHVDTAGISRVPQDGDIIELSGSTAAGQTAGTSGERGPLIIANVNGKSFSATNPIVIRGPRNGRILVRRQTASGSGGFLWQNRSVRGLLIDGYLASLANTQAGHYQCGIELTYAPNASSVNQENFSAFLKFTTNGGAGQTCKNFTVKHVEVDGGWLPDGNGLSSNGISISTEEGDSSPVKRHTTAVGATPKTITAITKAANAVVTCAAHGYAIGHTVLFASVGGMTQMNGRIGLITAITTNTFTTDINSSSFTAYTSGGTATKTYQGQWLEGGKILNCWIHDIEGEGGYFGVNYSSYGLPWRYCEVAYNRITNVGGDGIQTKCWWGPNYGVHDNIIDGAGQKPDSPGVNGISMLSGGGDVYNNIIYNTGRNRVSATWSQGKPNGLQFYVQNGPFTSAINDTYDGLYKGHVDSADNIPTSFTGKVYNNLLISNGSTGVGEASGIQVSNDGDTNLVENSLSIYCNTIAYSTKYGIFYNGSGGFIRNNIVVNNGTPNAAADDIVISAGAPTVQDNTTGVKSLGQMQAMFTDPTEDIATADYHLIVAIPVGASSTATHVPSWDVEGTPRSVATADRGAYEF